MVNGAKLKVSPIEVENVSLEHWDARSRRWILYRDQGHASDDCARYPFEEIPRRIFLDTSVLNLLAKYSEHIFEQEPIPARLNMTREHDIEALLHLFVIGSRANWDMVASSKTLEEIDQTADHRIRRALLSYALQIVDPNDADVAHATNLGKRLVDAPFAAALPDKADRELIGNAIGFGCDVFCTCDRRTIIKKRGQLPHLPIRFLTPIEWWAHVKPWSGLWL